MKVWLSFHSLCISSCSDIYTQVVYFVIWNGSIFALDVEFDFYLFIRLYYPIFLSHISTLRIATCDNSNYSCLISNLIHHKL